GPTLPRRDRSEEEKEQWCRAMLLLFKPWRSDSDIIESHPTWSSAWNGFPFQDAHRRIMVNMDLLHQCKDARNN
ncbi:hypothetical protein CALVIDRAFT_456737, partial [Calocera viscosa TUFC12733]